MISRRIFGVFAVFFVASAVAGDDAPPTPPELAKIQREYLQRLRQPSGQTRAALQQLRDDAIKNWIKELEAQQPADHGMLAEAFDELKNYAESARHGELAIQADPANLRGHKHLIHSLAMMGKVDEAERAFRVAEKRFPKSKYLDRSRRIIALVSARAGRPLAAAEWLGGAIDADMDLYCTSPINASQYLPRDMDDLIAYYRRADRLDLALGKVESYRGWLTEGIGPKTDPEHASALTELTARKIKLLVELGKRERADEVLAAELAPAEMQFSSQPTDVPTIRRLSVLLRVRSQLASDESPASTEARDRYAQFLHEQAAAHPDNAALISLWVEGQRAKLEHLVETQQVKAAHDAIAAAKSFVEKLSAVSKQAKPLADQAGLGSVFSWTERQIAAARPRAEMVGRTAPQLVTADWLQGEPITPEELKGKVVLLDFWAVWCGPCIAAFPKLRTWHEKFAEQGLVIIGVTQYYRYGWDADESRAVQSENLSHVDEQSALRQFAKHHQLPYRLAIDPQGVFWRQYHVGPLPQSVLIDRTGQIRLVVLGSYDAATQSLDEMLNKLLAEPIPK